MTDSQAPDPSVMQPALKLQAPRYYANTVQLKTSIFDVSMELGIIAEVTKDGVTADHVATVIMSPQHAKALSDLLVSRLADYETRFGTIPQLPASSQDGASKT